MPKKGSSRHHSKGRSPTPSTDTDSEDHSIKISKQKKSKSKHTSRRKGKRESHPQNSSIEKKKKIPNQNDLEAVDTGEIKELNSIIHLHLRILMRRPTATSPIPAPPTSSERLALEDHYAEADYPDDLAPCLLPPNPLIRITNRISDTFYDTLEMTLRRWGLTRFTFDWDGNFDDAYNQISVQLFLKTFGLAVSTREYGLKPLTKYRDPIQLVAVLLRTFKSLRAGYKAQIGNPLILQERYESNEARKEKENRLTEYREFAKECGVQREIASIFKRKNYMIMGDVEQVEIRIGSKIQRERRVYHPQWWSEKMIRFMKFLEHNIQLSFQLTIKRRGSKRIPISYVPSPHQDFQNVPEGLPSDLYSDDFKSILLPIILLRYKRTRPCLPSLNQDIKNVFPQPGDMIDYSTNDSLASRSDADSPSSHSDHTNSIKENNSDIEMSHVKERQHDHNRVDFGNSEIATGSEDTFDSPSSNALTLYNSSGTASVPLDTSPSSPTLDTTAEVEELQIALQSQQAIMDQRLSQLTMGYKSNLEQQLEAERNLMRNAIEAEKQRLISEMAEEQESLLIEKNRIAAEKEELKAEKERLENEKHQINAAVIAEKERIDAVVSAEKNMINSAVVAAQEEFESERLKLQNKERLLSQIEYRVPSVINQGHSTGTQGYQPHHPLQTPNHLYPPNRSEQPNQPM